MASDLPTIEYVGADGVRRELASTPIGDAHLRLAYRADETDWTAAKLEEA